MSEHGSQSSFRGCNSGIRADKMDANNMVRILQGTRRGSGFGLGRVARFSSLAEMCFVPVEKMY